MEYRCAMGGRAAQNGRGQKRTPGLGLRLVGRKPRQDRYPHFEGDDGPAGITVTASAGVVKEGGWRAVPAWKWLLATGVFVLIGAAMTAGVLYSSHAGPFREGPTGPMHPLAGSVTLLHQTVRGTPGEVKACAGTTR